MSNGEAGTLETNLKQLQVAPQAAKRLRSLAPTGCRLDVLSADEARLYCQGQAVYGEGAILEQVAGQARELMADQQPDVIVFFGLGLGFHLAALRQLTNAPIVVFEPSADLAAFVLARITVELDDVYLTVDSASLTEVLYTLLPERHQVIAGAIPTTRALFEAQFDDFCRVVNEEIGRHDIARATQKAFAEKWVSNLAANLPLLGSLPSLGSLGRRFAGRPAILVGAGPSLDRNLEDLAAAQGKALILAVHTAVRPLVQAGIVPDLVVIIECQALDYYFEGIPEVARSVLLVSPHTHPQHLALGFRETVVVNVAGVAAAEWLQQAYGERPLPSGGSVACMALAALHELGSDPIALVGMDTAYSDDRGHARHSQADCCEFIFDTKKETVTKHCRIGLHSPLVFRLMMVPAWGGQGQVATRPALTAFRLWFEDAARTWAADRALINATEGGARIKGFREQALAEFRAEFCEQDIPAGEMIATALAVGQKHDPALLVAAVQSELEVIRQAGQAAELVGEVAAKVLAKLRAEQFSTVQPLLDALSARETELRALSRRTRLLNTLMGGRIEDLAAVQASGDHVAQTIHSVEQSRRVSRLIIAGARELQGLFEPVLKTMSEAGQTE